MRRRRSSATRRHGGTALRARKLSGVLPGLACAHVAQIDHEVDVRGVEIDSVQHLRYLVISAGGDR